MMCLRNFREKNPIESFITLYFIKVGSLIDCFFFHSIFLQLDERFVDIKK